MIRTGAGAFGASFFHKYEEEMFHWLGMFFKINVWPAMGVSIIG